MTTLFFLFLTLSGTLLTAGRLLFARTAIPAINSLICMSLKLKDTVYSYCRNADGSYREMTEAERKAFKPRYAAGFYGDWVDLETGKKMPDGWQPHNVVPEN